MKIAVVHDYFTQLGGGEKVAEELFLMFPTADLFATVALRDKLPVALKETKIHTSWMQKLPFMSKLYRAYFPLYPFAVRSLDLSAYDLVVSSSSGYVKGIRVAPDALHVCYCHTPMRWAWNFEHYSSREAFTGLTRRILPSFIRALQRWDEAAAQQPDHLIANSHVVAKRILKAYGRTAAVIAPPIETERFRLTNVPSEDYYIVLARLVPYKRIDVAVDAFSKMGKKLYIIGSGSASERLRTNAGPTVHFLGRLSDEDVERYVTSCRALIFPGEEDFGMAPLEVAAAGRPTIAYRAGGATETIKEGQTGVFFDDQTPESLIAAVEHFETLDWDPAAIRRHAEGFSVAVFRRKIMEFLIQAGVKV